MPGVLGAVGKGASKIPYVFQGIKYIEKPLAIGLTGLYTYSVGTRTAAAKRPFGKLGEIGSTEVTPMIAGGYAGAKFWPKVTGYFRTRGRDEIAAEELGPEDVLMGKGTFPTAPTGKHKELFLSKSNSIF